jgi:hypothetical protein
VALNTRPRNKDDGISGGAPVRAVGYSTGPDFFFRNADDRFGDIDSLIACASCDSLGGNKRILSFEPSCIIKISPLQYGQGL